jgi:hypothetical protein
MRIAVNVGELEERTARTALLCSQGDRMWGRSLHPHRGGTEEKTPQH